MADGAGSDGAEAADSGMGVSFRTSCTDRACGAPLTVVSRDDQAAAIRSRIALIQIFLLGDCRDVMRWADHDSSFVIVPAGRLRRP